MIIIKDNIYPFQGITHQRQTVRSIAESSDGRLVYIRVKGQDIFGYRNHLESCGGGIEKGESEINALKREVMEELGYDCHIVTKLIVISHTLNLLKVNTCANYYYLKLDDIKHQTNLTDLEKKLFKGIELYSVEDAYYLFQNTNTQGINKLIHQREIIALEAFIQYKKTIA